MPTKKSVVGVIGSAHLAEGKFPAQRVSERILLAAADAAGALPLIFAGSPEIIDIGALLDTVDGVLLTGARANVHPSHFGLDEDPRHEPYDRNRDALALPLIEACVARGVPLLGICRGFQEINVAFGGSLHPEIRELPGRMNHRALRLENGDLARADVGQLPQRLLEQAPGRAGEPAPPVGGHRRHGAHPQVPQPALDRVFRLGNFGAVGRHESPEPL